VTSRFREIELGRRCGSSSPSPNPVNRKRPAAARPSAGVGARQACSSILATGWVLVARPRGPMGFWARVLTRGPRSARSGGRRRNRGSPRGFGGGAGPVARAPRKRFRPSFVGAVMSTAALALAPGPPADHTAADRGPHSVPARGRGWSRSAGLVAWAASCSACSCATGGPSPGERVRAECRRPTSGPALPRGRAEETADAIQAASSPLAPGGRWTQSSRSIRLA